MDNDIQNSSIRIVCRRLVIPKLPDQYAEENPQIQWLIGSPFFPSTTIISTIRCINSSHFSKESDDIKMLVPKGFEVIGALIVKFNPNFEDSAREAVDAAKELRELLCNDVGGGYFEGDRVFIGAVVDLNNAGDIQFFVSKTGNAQNIERVNSVVYEEPPEKFLWERGCMPQCQLPIKIASILSRKKPERCGGDVYSCY